MENGDRRMYVFSAKTFLEMAMAVIPIQNRIKITKRWYVEHGVWNRLIWSEEMQIFRIPFFQKELNLFRFDLLDFICVAILAENLPHVPPSVDNANITSSPRNFSFNNKKIGRLRHFQPSWRYFQHPKIHISVTTMVCPNAKKSVADWIPPASASAA